jgi:hypothetical protein
MITCKDMLFIVESSVKGIFFNPGSRKPLLKKKLMAVRMKAPLCKGSLENAQQTTIENLSVSCGPPPGRT